MTGQWKPGDVAMVTRKDGVSFLAHWDDSIWCGLDSPHGAAPHEVAHVRPLVVIDPEDIQQVERVRDALWTGGTLDRWQAALRSLIAPSKPEEPKGLGAVVEAVYDNRFVHIGGGKWKRVGSGEPCAYDEINVVRILSGGVA